MMLEKEVTVSIKVTKCYDIERGKDCVRTLCQAQRTGIL